MSGGLKLAKNSFPNPSEAPPQTDDRRGMLQCKNLTQLHTFRSFKNLAVDAMSDTGCESGEQRANHESAVLHK